MTGKLEWRALEECRHLMLRYADAIDRGDAVAFANLFTRTGTLLLPNVTLQGREKIQRAVDRRGGDVRSRHVITNRLAWRQDDEWRGSCYLTLYRSEGAAPQLQGPRLVGTYQDTYAREEGSWLIASRALEICFEWPEKEQG